MRRRLNMNGLLAVEDFTETHHKEEKPSASSDGDRASVKDVEVTHLDPEEITLEQIQRREAAAAAAAGAPGSTTPVQVTPTPAVITPAVADMTEAVETDLQESTDMEHQVGQLTDDACQAVEVAECLESLRDVLQASVPEGGIDRHSAAALKIATECLHESVGIAGYVFPSSDKFSTTSGRMRFTQVALEGLGEGLKKIWDAIVRVIKASVEWLTERFQLFFVSAEKIEKRALEIVAKAGHTRVQPKSTVFKNASLVKSLHIAGKVNAQQATAAIREQVKSVMNKRLAAGKSVYDRLEQILDGKSSDYGNVLTAVREFGDDMTEVKNPSAEGLTAPSEAPVVLRSKELPGGRAVVMYLPSGEGSSEDIESMTKRIMAVRAEVAEAYAKTEVDAEQELSVLSPSLVKEVAGDVVSIARNISLYKSAIESMNSVKKRIIQRAEAQARTVDAEKNPEGAKAARALVHLAPWALKTVEQPCAGFTLYSLQTCKSLLDYCTVSLKESEGEQKKADSETDKSSPLADAEAKNQAEKSEAEKKAAQVSGEKKEDKEEDKAAA